MYRDCVAPYPTGTQPVTKTHCKIATGPCLPRFATNFLRFAAYTIIIYKLFTNFLQS